MLSVIMMGILVHDPAENIRWAVCSPGLVQWSERVCLIDRDHQLGLVGMFREDSLEAAGHFRIGNKEMRSEILRNTRMSFCFCFEPRHSATDSAI